MERTPTEYRPRPYFTSIERRRGEKYTENKPLVPGNKDLICPLTEPSVSLSVLGSVRSDARARMQGGCAEELAMRLDKDGVGDRGVTPQGEKRMVEYYQVRLLKYCTVTCLYIKINK